MRKVSIILLFLVIASTSNSQKIDLNLFLGASNYEGDMQSNFFKFTQPGFTIGGGITYQLSDRIYVRTGITFASLSADDKKNPKVYFRNLNFKTSIQELHLAFEYHLFNIDDIRFSPYFFGGLAVYHFNPYTKDMAGNKYYLQPLSTEGQGFYLNRKQYSLTQFAIPFGGGIKYALNDNIKIGVEVGMRKLFTDYLDDVSTNYVDKNLLFDNRGAKAVELAFRGGEIPNNPVYASYPAADTKRGDPSNKDWYYFTGLTLSIRLPNKGEIDDRLDKPRKRNKYIMACPSK